MDTTTAVVLLIVANIVVWWLANRRRDRLNRRLPPLRRRAFFGRIGVVMPRIVGSPRVTLYVIAVLLLVGSGIIAQACWTTDTEGGVNMASFF